MKLQPALARMNFPAWNFPSGTKIQSAERIAATVEIARVSDKKKSYQLRVRTLRRPVELGGRFYRKGRTGFGKAILTTIAEDSARVADS